MRAALALLLRRRLRPARPSAVSHPPAPPLFCPAATVSPSARRSTGTTSAGPGGRGRLEGPGRGDPSLSSPASPSLSLSPSTPAKAESAGISGGASAAGASAGASAGGASAAGASAGASAGGASAGASAAGASAAGTSAGGASAGGASAGAASAGASADPPTPREGRAPPSRAHGSLPAHLVVRGPVRSPLRLIPLSRWRRRRRLENKNPVPFWFAPAARTETERDPCSPAVPLDGREGREEGKRRREEGDPSFLLPSSLLLLLLLVHSRLRERCPSLYAHARDEEHRDGVGGERGEDDDDDDNDAAGDAGPQRPSPPGMRVRSFGRPSAPRGAADSVTAAKDGSSSLRVPAGGAFVDVRWAGGRRDRRRRSGPAARARLSLPTGAARIVQAVSNRSGVYAVTAGGRLFRWAPPDTAGGHGGRSGGREGSEAGSFGRPKEILPVDQKTKWMGLAAGEGHVVALTNDGKAWAKGDNTFGQCGAASSSMAFIESFQPLCRTEPRFPRFVQVACGDSHTLLVGDDGLLYSCGLDRWMQLGHSVNWHSGASFQPRLRLVEPVRRIVEDLSERIVKVDAGADHSICLTSGGNVLTWGLHKHAQLGRRVRTKYGEPALVSALRSQSIVDIASGSAHCVALDREGSVWGWGRNAEGQLGKIKGVSLNVWEPIQCNSSEGSARVVSISAGGSATYMLSEVLR